MPYATRAERIAVILSGGTPPPDPAMLVQMHALVERAGFGILPAPALGEPSASQAGMIRLGPLSGVLEALEHCIDLSDRCLLVLPADMPYINPRALHRLADIAEAHGRGALFDLGPLPMALILNDELNRALRDAVQDPALRSLRSLAEHLALPIVASLPDDGMDNLSVRLPKARASQLGPTRFPEGETP